MVAIEGEHWWFLGRGALVRTLVRDECAARGGHVERLVDVGPGTGGLLADFGQFANEAIGVELNSTAIDLTRARGLDVRQGSATALPFADASVDVATAFDVLEHLDDDAAAARELQRVLRAGGVAIVTVPAYQWLWSARDDVHAHKRRYTRRRLVQTLRTAGLDVTRSGYFMTLLFPLAVIERFAVRLLRRTTHDLSVPPAFVNRLFLRIVLAEGRALRHGGFPFGLTVFAVAVPRKDT